ncbi:MAG: S46 family peptidase [Verrucomicrobia bacterium]|nr:S46 family peptidase [Verrucomicrobiota bacterium]
MGKLGPKPSDRVRFDAVGKRVKDLTAACEKGGLRCTISSFFEGKKWFKINQMEIQDVRLVYAPAAGINFFSSATSFPALRARFRSLMRATQESNCLAGK